MFGVRPVGKRQLREGTPLFRKKRIFNFAPFWLLGPVFRLNRELFRPSTGPQPLQEEFCNMFDDAGDLPGQVGFCFDTRFSFLKAFAVLGAQKLAKTFFENPNQVCLLNKTHHVTTYRPFYHAACAKGNFHAGKS